MNNKYRNYQRIFLIVADSLGVGAAKDSNLYNDEGSNTLYHLSLSKNNFSITTLEKMGIGYITNINNTKAIPNPISCYGKMEEISVGKDTLTGHWELMGLNVTTAFPSFTDTGFPKDLINELERRTKRKVVGNIASSGTEIIKQLGEEHLKTGNIIVYTSSDSVLQIAANEQIIPVEELYKICEIARELTLSKPEWMVGRVIARPFIGNSKENFIRTPKRHDYAVSPTGKTVLDNLKENNYDVIGIGKINDIFNGCGITESKKITSNHDGMLKTMEMINKDFTGLCFVNLVDFDSLYGHRRDPIGYANCLEEFDNDLKQLLNKLNDNDLLMICADHGNDPTFHGTDHTRENVPILVYNKNLKAKSLGIRKTFADVGYTIANNFNVQLPKIGKNLL